MKDQEKFEGLKQQILKENEQKYGEEVRKRYGEKAVNGSYEKVSQMTKEQWDLQEQLSTEILECLGRALKEGNPKGEFAQKTCELHRRWLQMFWKEGTYSKEAQKNLVAMYQEDERFRNYYETVGKGATEFFYQAMEVYADQSPQPRI